MKRKAAKSDLPSKYLAAEAVSGMGFEARSKLGCQIVRYPAFPVCLDGKYNLLLDSRHPLNPCDLENLTMPEPYALSADNECLMLWDSGYSTQTTSSGSDSN